MFKGINAIMETLFKTDDVEVTRSKRGTISFTCNDKTSAMFDLFTRITELEEQLQNTVNDRNEAWFQLEANDIEIKPVTWFNGFDYPR
jgi:hypothetical protein